MSKNKTNLLREQFIEREESQLRRIMVGLTTIAYGPLAEVLKTSPIVAADRAHLRAILTAMRLPRETFSDWDGSDV